MSTYSDQYVVYGYWEYGYAVGDVLPTEASASVTGVATVSPLGSAIYPNQASSVCSSSVYAEPIRLRIGSSSVSASATTLSDGIRMRTAVSNLDGTSTVSASSIYVAAAASSVISVGVISGYANFVTNGHANATGSASVYPNGKIIGEDWNIIPENDNTWTDVSHNANAWTQENSSSNTWVDVATNSNAWTTQSTGSNTWQLNA